ncbi:hypothetical protein PMY56_07420 [Clostridium tertium]|jgi:hypothetical protein|uniref:Uncharacterized protein n=2 Tax=Clostridium tertium TaxID=1559 RepID=A0A9X3XI35_9CLOT|nr:MULTISPECIES: hypothetical protein [Clostridium]EEH98678.1 hypothetical protein CSBG_02304 [Clostridium sp. 7_2_43FAA]MBP1868640.1 hypothetical protein [Clostridium tertium]MBS5305605.1 hypothetical protein [Clostridium sp.]MBS5885019.1 hypothetical protein [Clostridium sp.]MDB1923720.1 hypothetical protein [Clostridium tertium]
MNRETKNQVYAKAKEMIIAGESWDKIMEETRLRQKDLKRIQMTEIDPKF